MPHKLLHFNSLLHCSHFTFYDITNNQPLAYQAMFRYSLLSLGLKLNFMTVNLYGRMVNTEFFYVEHD